jgi:hypothetical protein
MTEDEQVARLENYFDHLVSAVVEEVVERQRRDGKSQEEIDALLERGGPSVVSALMDTTPLITQSVKKIAPEGLFAARRDDRSYSREIERHWSSAFDLYELTMRCCVEVGEDFVAARIEEGQGEVSAIVGPVVTRIHARACRIAREVLVLMRAGFAQGALARWRALHELSVVCSFIIKYDDEAAARYLAHGAVERYRAMLDYQRCQPRLKGYEPIDEDEIAKAKKTFDDLKLEYGSSFAAPYGWATAFIGARSSGEKLRGLAALEAEVDLDHLRSHYRQASYPVHSGPAGSMFSSDLMPELGDLLLVGPSPRGMAEPGHASLISLAQITTSVLGMNPGTGSLVMMQVILELTDEAGEAFLRCSDRLEIRGAEGFGSWRSRFPVVNVRDLARSVVQKLIYSRRGL